MHNRFTLHAKQTELKINPFVNIRLLFSSFRKKQLFTGAADKSLARSTSRCILFDGENISFDAGLVIYINITNIPTIMFINRVYEHQKVLSL